MITEEEFVNKVEELASRTLEDMLGSARILYRSGAIDPEDPSYTNSYILPKLFMMAYAARLRDIWSPWGNRKMNPKINKVVKNIERFI